MSTHARLPRTIKHYGIPHIVKTPDQIDTDGKGDCCPKCKARNSLKFMGEDLQTGFVVNKYFEYLECAECGANVCVLIVQKAKVFDA